ncbi:MAG: peptidylprolyl isomerase, partial [Acidobacteriaceae bacterium]|nr:peptidylprolyl isomerase [Acidobacteriaceae bacterium]
GLVAISMLAYLVPGGYGGASGPTGQNIVAAVGDDQVTTIDVQRAIQRLTRNQSNLPKGLLAMYVPSLVSQLIEAKAMAYKAREMGLRISDAELADAIQNEVSSQLGGKFDMSIYQAALAQQSITVADYEKQRRDAMLGMRLETMELQSLIVSDQDAKAEYARKNLKVGLEYLAFEAKDFTSKVNKDPAAMKAYFDKNRSLFRTPEKRDFELIVGTTADFVQAAKISDDQLRREYQDSLDTYQLPERVKVRHILIKTQGKPKEEAPKLKAKAEDLLKQLQHGGEFAELAKKNSDDPGSAQKGGELGWIVRGQTVPNFEKTAFSLKPGTLSGVIETEYGYHIIQVEDKQAGHTQSFEEVKPQLIAEDQKQAGADNLKNAMDAAHAEIARNPAQAEAIAKKYNLKFFKLSNFVSTGTMPEMGTQPEVMHSIFSASKGAVTDVVDVESQSKDSFAVITNVIPARNAEYTEVEGDVLQHYITAESTRLSQDAAKSAADRARKGESLEALAKEYGLTVKTAAPFTIDGAAEGIGAASMLSAAFKGNTGDVVGPVAAQAGQFVCKVTQKIPADMTQFVKNKDSIVQNLTQQRQAMQQPLFRASVVSELRRRGKIKINQAAVEQIVGSYQG